MESATTITVLIDFFSGSSQKVLETLESLTALKPFKVRELIFIGPEKVDLANAAEPNLLVNLSGSGKNYATAINQALRLSGAELFLMIPSGTTLKPAAGEAVAQTFKLPATALTVLFDADQPLDSPCHDSGTFLHLRKRFEIQTDITRVSRQSLYTAWTGLVFAGRTQDILALNGLDDSFEDPFWQMADLCLRLFRSRKICRTSPEANYSAHSTQSIPNTVPFSKFHDHERFTRRHKPFGELENVLPLKTLQMLGMLNRDRAVAQMDHEDERTALRRRTFPNAYEYAYRNMLLFTGKNKNVLELGCGTGHLTSYMKRAACQIHAVDFNAESLKTAALWADSTQQMNLEEPGNWPRLGGTYDVVTFGDVIEHLRNSEDILKHCHHLLKPGGAVCLSIPNIAHWSIRWSLLRGRWNYTDTGILDQTHIRFYTHDTMMALFSACGFFAKEETFSTLLPDWLEMLLRNLPWLGARLRQALLRRFPNLFAVQFQFKLSPLDPSGK